MLVSAFQDEKTVVPVEMEVKTFWSANSQLYMTVALTRIDSEVLEKAPAIKMEIPLLCSRNLCIVYNLYSKMSIPKIDDS